MEKQNLIVLHGALGSKAQLKKLKQTLQDDFIVFDMNFEGHGDVLSSSPYSISLFADDLKQFITKNNIEKSHIFGYSMGGYVALRLAHDHPDLIGKIITLGTKFNWTTESAAAEIKKLNPEVIESKVPAFAQYLNTLQTANRWKEVVHKTASMMTEMGAGKKLHSEELKEIPHEVLICLGDEDNMVSVNESEHAHSLMANSSFKIIPNCKHPIERVDLNQMVVTIKDFIQEKS